MRPGLRDQLSLSARVGFSDAGVFEVRDILGERTTTFYNLAAALLDRAVRQKLVALGWTPPVCACAGHRWRPVLRYAPARLVLDTDTDPPRHVAEGWTPTYYDACAQCGMRRKHG